MGHSKACGPYLVPVPRNVNQEARANVKPGLAVKGCRRSSPRPAAECCLGCIWGSSSLNAFDLRGWRLKRAPGSAHVGLDPVPTYELGQLLGDLESFPVK